MESEWKEKYESLSLHNGDDIECEVYVMKAASVYYIGFEDTGKGDVTINIGQMVQDMTIKYKTTKDNYFFFKWYPRYPNRGVEQIEFMWEGPFPNTVTKTSKFCDYKNNPFFN